MENELNQLPYYNKLTEPLLSVQNTILQMLEMVDEQEDKSSSVETNLFGKIEETSDLLDCVYDNLSHIVREEMVDREISENSTEIFRKKGTGELFRLDNCKKTDRRIWLERIEISSSGNLEYTEDYRETRIRELSSDYEEVSNEDWLRITKPLPCISINEVTAVNKAIDSLNARIIHGKWIETHHGYFRVADISALITPDITIDGKRDNSCYLVLRSGRQYWVRREEKDLLLNLIGIKENNVATAN